MFDIETFANLTCELAYPGRVNEMGERTNAIDYSVQDILGEYTKPDGSTGRRMSQKLTKNKNMVIVEWRVSGVNYGVVDLLESIFEYEITVSATSIRALNAFHWAINEIIRRYNEVTLSTFVSDIPDETIGRNPKSTGRVSRAWGIAVDSPIPGLSEYYVEAT